MNEPEFSELHQKQQERDNASGEVEDSDDSISDDCAEKEPTEEEKLKEPTEEEKPAEDLISIAIQ